MPLSNMNQLKGTSPSKNVQRANDQAWGAQNNQSSTSPQTVLSKKWTKQPIKVGGKGK